MKRGQTFKKNSRIEYEADIRLQLAIPVAKEDLASLKNARPKTRLDCIDGLRPCPFISCRHNSYIEVEPDGSIQFNDNTELTELSYSNCSLDYDGARHLDDSGVASRLGTSRQNMQHREIPNAIRRASKLSILVEMPTYHEGNLSGAQVFSFAHGSESE